jgi:hypothetical protein
MKNCKHCNIDFNEKSDYKRKIGGYIDECPDCVQELGTEKAVRYRGVIDGSGKMAALSIVAFASNEEADEYVSQFNSCGFGRRKMNSCNEIRHQHISFQSGNDNHKGKQ